MKKLLIVAVASSLILISCKKDAAVLTNQSVNKASLVVSLNHCYLLSNIETTAGYSEYSVRYTDCNNVVQNEPLPFGQRLMLCLQNGTVQTNFAYTLADRGDCLTARP